MSQTDLNVADASGATVRADINAHLDALVTLSSGASEPSPTFPNQLWVDTSTSLLKMRDTGNSIWITLGTLDLLNLGLQTVGTVPHSHLSGLTLSNNSGDATNDIDISLGAARNNDDDGNLVLAAAVGKRIDASWAVGGTPGTPTGGLSSSLSLANDTWYHVHLILVAGVVEVGFDTSVIAAKLIADHSATEFRRIGSVRRGTAANILFTQTGDEFVYANPPLSVDTTITTSTASYILFTPLGVRVRAIFNTMITNPDGAARVYIRDLIANDEAPSGTAAPLSTISVERNLEASQKVEVMTNTSSQIAARSDTANTTFRISTLGYIDRRGKDD